jgi:hypothetical protein
MKQSSKQWPELSNKIISKDEDGKTSSNGLPFPPNLFSSAILMKVSLCVCCTYFLGYTHLKQTTVSYNSHYHTIHPFSHSSVVFKDSQSCAVMITTNFRISSTPKKKPGTHQHYSLLPTKSLALGNQLLSAFMEVNIQDTSYKWAHKYVLLYQSLHLLLSTMVIYVAATTSNSYFYCWKSTLLYEYITFYLSINW